MGYVYYVTQDAAKPQQMAEGVWFAGHILVARSEQAAYRGEGAQCVLSGQAAAHLGCTEKAIWNMVNRGTLVPYCRMGSVLLFNVTDINNLADQRGISHDPHRF